MKENNLLASVALFSSLYKSETYKSIPDILVEFIKGAINFEQKFSFDSNELKEMLFKAYGFNIPESVLRTTLKNKMKGQVSKNRNIYHFSNEGGEINNSFSLELEDISKIQKKLFEELYQYIEEKEKSKLTSKQKEEIHKNFTEFLLDIGYSAKYSDLISAFLISKEKTPGFSRNLNSIKEGVILYQGINYSADINQLGRWNEELTIYLSTEHLFNCLGYNGELFEEIFQDFFNLVSEINMSYKGKLTGERRKLIELKYLEETKKEVEDFFSSAESIRKGFLRLDPSKLAMRNILKGTNSVSDVKSKQVRFFLDLKNKGILYQDFSYDSINQKYNVVDNNLIEELKTVSEERGKYFDEDFCEQCLRIYTKINCYRRGKNSYPFEKVRHIYITENNFAKYLAHNNNVKFGEYDTAFAKDIDFAISKFWFKLKKGFNNQNELPKTFDVVNKAKIIISSHLNSSVSDSYNKLQKEYKEGVLTKEQAIELSLAYKERPNSPEHFNSENIDETLDFLFDEQYVEDFLREKLKQQSLFEATLKEKAELKAELEEYKEVERRKLQKKERIEFEKRRNLYSEKKIKIELDKNRSNLYYFYKVLFLTLLPILLGILFKSIKPVNSRLESIGNYQFIIWGVLVLIFLIEIFGRSYIFDKQRVKKGWHWLSVVWKGEKQKKISELKKRFDEEYQE